MCVHACSVISDSLQTPELQPDRFLCPWDFPDKNTGVGCHFLLQRIFPMWGSNLCLLCLLQTDSLLLSHHRSPEKTMAFVQSLSHVWLFATPWTAECQAFFSFTVTQSLLKLMSIELVMPSNHLILSPSSPPSSVFPSIRIFSHESALCIRWPKYWSFSLSPSNEYSGLISFRIGWFYLLALQGTPKSLLQHHNSKES